MGIALFFGSVFALVRSEPTVGGGIAAPISGHLESGVGGTQMSAVDEILEEVRAMQVEAMLSGYVDQQRLHGLRTMIEGMINSEEGT